jgi:hypothetical protein
MLTRTFYLDVKDAVGTLNRFEVRFALDNEARGSGANEAGAVQAGNVAGAGPNEPTAGRPDGS